MPVSLRAVVVARLASESAGQANPKAVFGTVVTSLLAPTLRALQQLDTGSTGHGEVLAMLHGFLFHAEHEAPRSLSLARLPCIARSVYQPAVGLS